ncbi:hypothetical protein GGR54DRAFT_649281 [Hypoxylon sp. NC1633]|nr:hypothetical protein GGR54DRAFT_649281 [Hypoxylon sp. NC1633]
MSQTYHLDFERHVFHADALAIRPIAPENATSPAPAPAGPLVLYADVHRGHLVFQRQPIPVPKSERIAKATYPADAADIHIAVAAAGPSVKLTHSHVLFDNASAAAGAGAGAAPPELQRTRENPRPKRSFWRRRVKDGSRGCYVATLPDGPRVRREPAGPAEEDADAGAVAQAKAEAGVMNRAANLRPKMRCVLVDALGLSTEVLGEMMRSNDVVRLARGGGLLGAEGVLGVYVLLGFVSLYERARARNRRRAELEVEVDFTFDGDGGAGAGDGGGGDGGGGGGGGGD